MQYNAMHVSAFYSRMNNYGGSTRFLNIIRGVKGGSIVVAPELVDLCALPVHTINASSRFRKIYEIQRAIGKYSPNIVASDFLPSFFPNCRNDIVKAYLIHDVRVNTKYKKAGLRGWEKLYKFIINQADFFIVPSEFTKRCLQEYTDKEIYVIPNGIDYTKIQPSTQREYRCGYIAANQPRKEIGRYLDLVHSCRLSSESWLLTDCTKTFERNWGGHPAIANSLIVREGLSELQKYQLLGNTQVYISTSSFEGFGMPIAEALASGCNLLITPIDAHQEVLAYFDIIDGSVRSLTGELPVDVDNLNELIAVPNKSYTGNSLCWSSISEDYQALFRRKEP